jgi:membrane protein
MAKAPRRPIGAWQVAPWLGMLTLLVLWPRRRRRVTATSETRQLPAETFEALEPGRGRAARRPGQIPLSGWKDILWRTWLETNRDRLQMVAAGVTYYVLLAIFPGMAAFVSLYGLFADVAEVRKQLDQMAAVLPPGAVDLIGTQMLRLATTHHASLSLAFGLSLLVSLWSANAGIAALFDGLNIAYDETEKRKFLKRRLFTYGCTAVALVFMLGVSAVMVGGPMALSWIGVHGAEGWWLPVVWVLMFVFTALGFSLLYRFGPSREKARWQWLTWGGSLAAIAWLVGSLIFSAYVNNFSHFDATYGSLGAFVGFMVWVWFSVFVVLLGAELNSEIEHQTAVDSTTGLPLPMGRRGAVVADTVGLPATRRNAAKIRRRPGHIWTSLRNQFWSATPPPDQQA